MCRGCVYLILLMLDSGLDWEGSAFPAKFLISRLYPGFSIRPLHLVTEAREDDLLDASGSSQVLPDYFDSNIGGSLERVAVDPRADGRKGNTSAGMLIGQFQGVAIGRGQ